MRTKRAKRGARLLAVLPAALLFALAGLGGLRATPAAQGPAAEACRPIQTTGWGDHSAPAGWHQLERGRLGSRTVRPGLHSTSALPHAGAFAAPGGATGHVDAADTALLRQECAGAHSGRAPPRNP